jgi:RNA polymerase sigma factor (sigma-70 family)
MTATDLVLLKRWQTRRDPEAFQELVHRHANMVFATCRRVLGNAADAEEVAQDCFLSLADSANKPTRSLGGWLHVLATSRARDRIRGDVRRRQREERFAEEQEPKRESPEAVAILDDALATLPDQLREPLVVHFLEGLTHAETAKRLGVSRPTVTRRINKALTKLREEMRGRNAVITAAALTKLLTAESASAAPATLIAQLGTIALNASPYAVAAGGGGLFIYGLGAVVIIAILAGVVGIAAPRVLQRSQTQNAQNTVVTTVETRSTASAETTVATVVETSQLSSVVETIVVSDGTPVDPAGARIHGFVYDLAGEPVSGIQVEAHNAEDVSGAKGKAETAANGHYEISGIAPTGILFVHAFDRSSEIRSAPYEIPAVLAGRDYEVDLTLHESSVSGVVVDDKGRTIKDAEVAAMIADVKIYGRLPMSDTDDSGRFEIAGLFAGEYKMSVRIGGRQNPFVEVSRIELGEGQRRSGLRLVYEVPGNRWIWGTVTDSESNPLSDVKVQAYNQTHTESTFATSQPDGSYLIALDGDGPFYVSALHREFSGAFHRNVLPDAGPLHITMESYGGLEATVVDGSSGKPIPQFEVKEMIPVSDAPDTMYHENWRAVSNPNGVFTMARLNRGPHTVHVRASGYANTEQRVQIYPGVETPGVAIEMDPARRIAGLVVDDSSQPVVGARVFAGPLPSNFRSSTMRTQEPVLTDAEGRFEIEDASTMQQSVSAFHHAYAPITQSVSGDLNAIRIVLHEGGSLSGAVTVNGSPAIDASVFAVLNPESHPVSIARANTDDNGDFELSKIGPGLVTAYADLDLERPYGERNMSHTIEVNDGKTTPIYFDFKIGNAGIEGMVSVDGVPISDALVLVSTGATRLESESANIRSDAEGRYRIEGLAPGSYELKTFIPGLDQVLQPESVTATLTSDNILHFDLVY